MNPAKTISQTETNYVRNALAEIAFIRAFEAKALALSQQDPPLIKGSMHLCAGQEGVPVGAIAGLREDDQIISTYRGHGWALASGLDPFAVMAELCHRRDGINGGRGGSAYLMAPSTRFIGENSIVGAGTTIACGVALSNVQAGNGRVVVVSIGDGATNQGAVHEAMAFAVVRKLPVIFVVENNGWAELTATEDMIKVPRVAQRAHGYGMASATIDGTDPIVVRDSFAYAAQSARSGEGPVLLECRVPRLWGHYNRDIEHYRPSADRKKAAAQDPLVSFGDRAIAAGLMTRAELDGLVLEQQQKVEAIAERAIQSPAPQADTASLHVVAPPAIAQEPQVLRVEEMKYIEAVNLALRTELEADARTVLYGEDVGKSGGIFAASRYLQRDFGADRVFDTPIAENAILGSAVGAAMTGLRPIVEIMWADFIFVAIDQVINQAANIRYVTQGETSVPMVVRTQQGALPGSCSQHSQSIEAFLAHMPGIKVALAATPNDAYALLRAAAADPDPVVVIEARGEYQTKGDVAITRTAEPVGKSHLKRDGEDLLIITWGTTVNISAAAADALAAEGHKVAVLDLRWLAPLDEEAIKACVKTAGGKVLIVHEAVRTGGFAGEIAMRISEQCEGPLKIARHTTPDVRIPASPDLQQHLIPTVASICDAARSLLGA